MPSKVYRAAIYTTDGELFAALQEEAHRRYMQLSPLLLQLIRAGWEQMQEEAKQEA